MKKRTPIHRAGIEGACCGGGGNGGQEGSSAGGEMCVARPLAPPRGVVAHSSAAFALRASQTTTCSRVRRKCGPAQLHACPSLPRSVTSCVPHVHHSRGDR